MAQDKRHGQRTVKLTNSHGFPPTVVGHEYFKNGVELELLDPGTEEEPRYIWCPDDPDEEPVFAL